MMKQRQRLRTTMASSTTEDKEDSEGDETELFVRNSHPRTATVEKAIEENDTLQALSIKYRCSIAELKRLNHIHKENEIFARKTIRVPTHAITMALVHCSGSSSPKLDVDSSLKLLNVESLQSTLAHLPSTSSDLSVNDVIFNSSLKPMEKDCDSETVRNEIDERFDEEVCLLPTLVAAPETVVTRLSCNGADADISWIALLICVVILVFAIPLIYVLYIAEHPEHYHHHES